MAVITDESLMTLCTHPSTRVNRPDLERILYTITVVMIKMVIAIMLRGQHSAANSSLYWEMGNKTTSQNSPVHKAGKSDLLSLSLPFKTSSPKLNYKFLWGTE